MKRSLMLILVLCCGIYLVLTLVKGDVSSEENPQNPLSEDYSFDSGGDYIDV